MSVLNKMLRDLEQRQQSAPLTPAASIARGTARPLWFKLVLLSGVVLLGIVVFKLLSVPQPAATAAKAIKVESATAQTTDAVPVIEDSPANTASLNIELTPVSDTATDKSVSLTAPEQTDTPAILAVLTQPAVAEVMQQNSTETDLTPTVIAAPASSNIKLQAEPVEVARATSLQVERSVMTGAQRALALQQQAIAAAATGKLQQSLQLWQQLQQLTPADALVYLAQARLWLQLGQAETAERVLQQALNQQLVHADIALMLAQQAASRGQWQQVDTLLQPQFPLAEQPDYYGLKATALQQLNQQQAALQWFSQLITLQPQQPRWWLGAAIAFDALAQPGQAHLHYLQALQWGGNLSVASRDYIQQRLAATE